MHELAVTQNILDVVLAAAERADADAVTGIDLVIGDLASIVDDSVQFYFDILSQGTLAAGARLTFRREPAFATCRDCGARTLTRLPIEPVCPQCHGVHIQVTGGRDFRVESIDIEEKAKREP